MKKYLYILLLIALILNISLAYPNSTVFARPAQQGAGAIVTFDELGVSDLVMRGPYDSKSFSFSLPAYWVLQEGSELQLIIDAAFTGETTGSQEIRRGDYIGAVLDVYFNGSYQQSIPLQFGDDIEYRIPISPIDLVADSKDGSIGVYFELDASIDCDYPFHTTTVVINSASKAAFSYVESSVNLDLHRLPWPIYQRDAQLPGSALVVTPNNPTSSEMQSALLVMAAFGRMTNADLPISMVSVGALSDEMRRNSDLIFVGKPASFSMLMNVELPVPIVDGLYKSAEMLDDDGVVQIAASAWNKTRTVLVVGGNSDTGVVKAAQAITTSNLQTSSNSLYSVVAEVNPATSLGLQIESSDSPLENSDYTFSSLGYSAESSSGVGTHSFDYEFIIPPGQVPADKPYVDVVYTVSKLVDPTRSGMTISLNGNRIGSAEFSPEDPEPMNARANLPVDFLLTGRNTLTVTVALVPQNICSSISFSNGLWISIQPESVLHLPLVKAEATSNMLRDLRSYPYPFVNDPTLSTTMFVLPQENPAVWAVAGKVAFDLGSRATGSIFSFDVDFGDQTVEEIRKDRNLLIVGMPSEMSLVSALKENMPAYFEAGSNTAILQGQQVVYRISSNKNLGYLELFSLPWDGQYTALAILGTNPEGTLLATNALTQSQIRNTLKGNFATIDDAQTLVVDTRTGAGMGRVASENSPGDIQQTVPQADQPATATPDVLTKIRNNSLIGLAAILGLMLVVSLIALGQRKRRSLQNK